MRKILQISIIFVIIITLFSCVDPDTEFYHIYFESNGGSEVASLTVDQSIQISFPDDPIKNGYVFMGWFWDNDTFTDPVSEGTMILYEPNKLDLTVYAKWIEEENAVYITINSNGGPSLESFYAEKGSTITLPEVTRRGYTLNYWYTIVNQSVQFIQNNTFIVPSSINEVELQINWNLINYSINYNLNGGVNHISNPVQYSVVTDTIILNVPEKEGYSFLGWFDNENFTGLTISQIPFGSINDVNLYAKWEIKSYQINYNIFDHDSTNIDFPLEQDEIVSKIAIGSVHFGLLTSNGRVFTWGRPYNGQLGYYSSSYSEGPANITYQFNLEDEEQITNIFMGSDASFAITSIGKVYAWGDNRYGQLTDLNVIKSYVPIDITDNFGLLPNEAIIDLTVSYNRSLALTSFGRVLVWGNDYDVTLENGDHVNAINPTDITFQFELENGEIITSASVCYPHFIAFTSLGRVFSWGSNSNGKIGDGTTIDKSTPVDITNYFPLHNEEFIIQVDITSVSGIALSSTGRVFSWGDNSIGTLGNGTYDHSYVPIDITDHIGLNPDESVTTISSGTGYCVVITSSNRIISWGWINYKPLWEIVTNTSADPIQLFTQTDVLDDEEINLIMIGGINSAIMTASNKVFAWGTINEYLISNANESWNIYEILIDNNPSSQYIENSIYDSEIDLYEPVKEGYTFSGWFTDMRCQETFNLTQVPSHELMLYGYWIPNE